jgi:hypothetical protein
MVSDITFQARGLEDGIMYKAARNRELSATEKAANRMIRGVRSKVERAFGTLKRGHGYFRAGYLGWAKVELEFLLNAVPFNLKKRFSWWEAEEKRVYKGAHNPSDAINAEYCHQKGLENILFRPLGRKTSGQRKLRNGLHPGIIDLPLSPPTQHRAGLGYEDP